MMLQRNSNLIAPGSSRATTRSPVSSVDRVFVPPTLDLQARTDMKTTVWQEEPVGSGDQVFVLQAFDSQASTDTTATALQEEPMDCGDTSSSSRVVNLQATVDSTITVRKGRSHSYDRKHLPSPQIKEVNIIQQSKDFKDSCHKVRSMEDMISTSRDFKDFRRITRNNTVQATDINDHKKEVRYPLRNRMVHSDLSLERDQKDNNFIGPCRQISGRKTRCETCSLMDDATLHFKSSVTLRQHTVISKNNATCSSCNIIYLITCRRCKIQYVGETVQTLKSRMNGHRSTINEKKNILIAQHFNSECTYTDISVQPIEVLEGNGYDEKISSLRKAREEYWIRELCTVYPYGLNDRCNGIDWASNTSTKPAMSIFNRIHSRRKPRRRTRKNKQISHFSLDNFFKDLLHIYNNHGYWMNYCRRTIASLPKKQLKLIALRLESQSWSLVHILPHLVSDVLSDILDFKLLPPLPQNVVKSRRSVFLKVYFHNPGIEQVHLTNLSKVATNKFQNISNIVIYQL